MFDLTIPPSLAELPGRVIIAPEFAPKRPKRTHAERLAQMREYSRKRKENRLAFCEAIAATSARSNG